MAIHSIKIVKMVAKVSLILWLIFLNIFLSFRQTFAFWPGYQANYQRNGQTEQRGPLTPKIKWQFKGLGDYASVVVNRDGIIYAAGKDILYAIDQKGKEIWHYRYKAHFNSTPSLGLEGTVYITAEREGKTYLIAFDPLKGKVKWETLVSQHSTQYWISHIAIASSGRIYVAAIDYLIAFNPSGIKEWVYQFPSVFESSAPSLSPDEQTIYVYMREQGGLYALNQDGSLRWQLPVKYYTNFSSPTVSSDGMLYLVDSITASLYAITPEGKEKWVSNFSGSDLGNSSIALGKDGIIYVDIANAGDENGGAIYAMNPKDGKVRWRFEIKDGYVGTAPAIDGRGNLYYAAGNGNIYCLRPDGTLIWKYLVEKGARFFNSSPAIFQETFYVVTDSTGTLFAVGAASE